MQYSISNATKSYYSVFIQTLNKKPQAISCDGFDFVRNKSEVVEVITQSGRSNPSSIRSKV